MTTLATAGHVPGTRGEVICDLKFLRSNSNGFAAINTIMLAPLPYHPYSPPHTVIQNQCFHQCSVILAREWCFLLTGRPPLPLFGHSLPAASSWAVFLCFLHASKAIILLALSFQRATASRMAFACLLACSTRWQFPRSFYVPKIADMERNLQKSENRR